MNTKTRATLSYEHLSEDDTPDYGIPWLFNKPRPPTGTAISDSQRKLSQDQRRPDDAAGGARLSSSFNVHSIARAANYPRQAQITEPQICSNAALSVPVGSVVASLPTLAYNSAVTCPTLPTRRRQILLR